MLVATGSIMGFFLRLPDTVETGGREWFVGDSTEEFRGQISRTSSRTFGDSCVVQGSVLSGDVLGTESG